MGNCVPPWVDIEHEKFDDVSSLGTAGGDKGVSAERCPSRSCCCIYCIESSLWETYNLMHEGRDDLADADDVIVIRSLWSKQFRKIMDKI